jgi:acetyltransferase-like isoleucine patch superfamily enzyme
MNVFVELTGRRIAPFDDPIGETLIGNRPLSAWQDDAIAAAGLQRIDTVEPPCLVIPDTLFTTAGALRRFVDGAAGRDAVFVLGESRHGRDSVHVQPHVTRVEGGWRFERIRTVVDGSPPVDVVVDPDENILDLPVRNQYLGTDTIELAFPRHPVITLHHWVHILTANQLLGSIELRQMPKWRSFLKVLWAIIRALSINKWKVLGKLNTIGKNCDIHPTAVLEGATLGDNVSVGPFARVLFSRLGDGVVIMPGAQVDLCTVGDNATVSEQVTIRFCVLYPEAVVSQYLMQRCVLGRKSVTTGGAFSIDLNFDQDIRVPLDGTLYSSGTRFLGSAFGHRCRVGTGFWMASGRMVPNDYFVIRHPDAVLSKLPPGLAPQNPLAVSGRVLVPLGAAPVAKTASAPAADDLEDEPG